MMIRIFRLIIFINISLYSCDFYAQKESFRVMAWNILHGGNDIENGQQNVVKIIKEIDPDIILMVETYGSGPYIANELGYNFHLVASEGTSLDDKSVNLSVFSRFPFVERIDEILKNEDNSSPNCSLCKYRSNLFGFEKEVGLMQESHHDHVEGLGISCELCEAECSGACEIEIISSYSSKKDISKKNISEESDTSHHHHHTYPNAHHPLGPITLQSANKVKH